MAGPSEHRPTQEAGSITKAESRGCGMMERQRRQTLSAAGAVFSAQEQSI